MALSTCLPRLHLRIYSEPPHAHARNRIGIGSCCYQVGVGVGCRGPTRLSTICSSGGSDLASTAFTFGTAAVLPFYTLMILAPKAQLTRRAMDSTIPYTVLGLVYAYLVYLSWTPDTLRLMFATKYWLPELPGVAKMFSSEMTLASAWIHLLTGDLFAARCIYQEGLEKEVETRHSLTLCMFICPLGILTHTITKALTPTPTPASYGIGSTKHSSDHK